MNIFLGEEGVIPSLCRNGDSDEAWRRRVSPPSFATSARQVRTPRRKAKIRVLKDI